MKKTRILFVGVSIFFLTGCSLFGGKKKSDASSDPRGTAISQTKFDEKIEQLDGSVSRSNATLTAHYIFALGGIDERDMVATYVNQSNEWVISNNGLGSNTSMFKDAPNTFRVENYQNASANLASMLEDYQVKYYAENNGFEMVCSGKMDYSKINSSVEGKLDVELDVKWDYEGCPISYQNTNKGRLTISDTAYSYNEDVGFEAVYK